MIHGPEKWLKIISFPLLSGNPWIKKTIGIAWISINFEDNHGPRKSMKVLSFQLLSGRLMGQELHWNFLILRYFRTGPWRRKAIETLWFSISFGVIHGTENLMNFPITCGVVHGQKHQSNSIVFHYFRGGPWTKKKLKTHRYDQTLYVFGSTTCCYLQKQDQIRYNEIRSNKITNIQSAFKHFQKMKPRLVSWGLKTRSSIGIVGFWPPRGPKAPRRCAKRLSRRPKMAPRRQEIPIPLQDGTQNASRTPVKTQTYLHRLKPVNESALPEESNARP